MPLVVLALLEALRPVFHSCHTITATLAETIPQDEVWKWRELWIVPLRAAVFSVVLAYFLTDGTLASLSTIAEQLGSTSAFSSTLTLYTSFLVKEEWKDRFPLTPEDYLHGVITAINELVRMPQSPRFAEESMNQIRSLVWL